MTTFAEVRAALKDKLGKDVTLQPLKPRFWAAYRARGSRA
jgi:hypothetical protein